MLPGAALTSDWQVVGNRHQAPSLSVEKSLKCGSACLPEVPHEIQPPVPIVVPGVITKPLLGLPFLSHFSSPLSVLLGNTSQMEFMPWNPCLPLRKPQLSLFLYYRASQMQELIVTGLSCPL